VRRLERWAAPFVLVMTAVLLVWAVPAPTPGPIISSSEQACPTARSSPFVSRR